MFVVRRYYQGERDRNQCQEQNITDSTTYAQAVGGIRVRVYAVYDGRAAFVRVNVNKGERDELKTYLVMSVSRIIALLVVARADATHAYRETRIFRAAERRGTFDARRVYMGGLSLFIFSSTCCASLERRIVRAVSSVLERKRPETGLSVR